ncbi:thioredoxin domain-containing protein [Paenalkalicoccus suaedae]|uniref:Thioredoxin domain-containing protein n=1 Tax=Paenalkalicoccus suaedae TaxID=2592382 RepID=A0A859FEG1_9BACI|nr:thioredoxin domain-containing protein [Paenalkalicoccus suaedae]QKS71311.1 thioredoxin domain-containing protein [Paenalkalicoccus suaedae]
MTAYNHLKNETSPYLKQHAQDPIDWYPWGEEALQKARDEDKPIFLSIGYSTCHWCHVMQKETFLNEEVAKQLNETMVAIKVDREERPDIDQLYMQACQVMTGQGGWPMSLFLLPDERPFYAGLYYPPYAKRGVPGFIDVVSQLSHVYNEQRVNVIQTASNLTARLKETIDHSTKASVSSKHYNQANTRLLEEMDQVYGGFSDAPKFPMTQNISFLLRLGNEEPVYKTLDAMANGGIYDHLGGGFSRYSVDQRWHVPHFEKMLNDQALLIIAYVEAFSKSGRESYKQIATDTYTYVTNTLEAKGGFYSAEDADSEGVEGAFYVWDKREIEELLREDSALFCEAYHVTEEGVLDHKNVLAFLETDIDDLGEQFSITKQECLTRLKQAKKRLFEVREKRIRPHMDTKIKTAWNAQMVAAIALYARVIEDDAINHAIDQFHFIENTLVTDGRVRSVYTDGKASGHGILEDYASMLWAANELFETTGDTFYKERARYYATQAVELFYDEEGGFYYYGSDQPPLFMRTKDDFDGATPSANSMIIRELARHSTWSEDQAFEQEIDASLKRFAKVADRVPHAAPHLLVAAMHMERSQQLYIVADESDPLYQSVKRGFYPFVQMRRVDEASELPLAYQTAVTEKPTYLLCEHGSCKLPTSSYEAVLAQLT